MDKYHRSARLPAILNAAFYVTALTLVALLPKLGGAAAESLRWFVYVAALLLYGVGSTLALAHEPGDPRVRLFLAAGLQVALSLVLPLPSLAISPHWLLTVLVPLHPFVFLMSLGVYVHLAAMIPRRNPVTLRHRFWIPANYVIGVMLCLFATVGNLHFVLPAFPWSMSLPLLRRIVAATYLVAGIQSLMLLRHAAQHEETARGRQQALVVFLGLLPWTINIGCSLLLPDAVYPDRIFLAVQPFAVFLVPAGFLVAILGLRLFEVSSFARKSLIYGLTAGLLAVAIYVSMAGARNLVGHLLGAEIGGWNSAILLVLTGVALVPLLQRVTRAVDRVFFPEKLRLRTLQGSVIPALAGSRQIDTAAARLVSLIRQALGLVNASLLVADETRAFFRVRAQAGEFPDPRAREAVLTRDQVWEWLATREGGTLRARRFPDSSPALPPELGRMLGLLGARDGVPLAFNQELVGLLVLGATPSAVEFDAEDWRLLEDVARQASAMIENARLFDLASHDPLTGLANRQTFEQRLSHELDRSRRRFEPFAVGLGDLDGFKRINDSRGHLAGDRVLRAVTGVLAQATRRSDLLARFGGDEFAFLFVNTSPHGALHLTEALCQSIANREIEVEGGPPVSVTLSVGVHFLRQEDAVCSPHDLIQLADKALYEAKRHGGNRAVLSGG
ncbi:MAG: diguanylate cyclase [Thermoanaerobaculales bacterium]